MLNPKMMSLKPPRRATFMNSPTKGSMMGSISHRGSQPSSKLRHGSQRSSGFNLKKHDLFKSMIAKKMTVNTVYDSENLRGELNLDVMCTMEHDNRTPNPFHNHHGSIGHKHTQKKSGALKSGAATDRPRKQNPTDPKDPAAFDDHEHAKFEKSLFSDPIQNRDANKRRYFKLDNTVCNRKVLHNYTNTADYDPDSDYLHGETDMKTFNIVKEIDNWEITHDIDGHNFANAINVQGPTFEAGGFTKGETSKTGYFESYESSNYHTERLKQFAKADPNHQLINILNNSMRVKRPGVVDGSMEVGRRPFQSKTFVGSSYINLGTNGVISEQKKTGQNFMIGGPREGTNFVKVYADRMRDLNKGVLHQILWQKAQKKIENFQKAVASQSPAPKIPQTTRADAKSKSNVNILEKFRSG